MLAICLYSATDLQPMGWCVMHENMLQLSLTNSMLECSGCWITIVKTSSSDQPSCCRNTIARPARKILPCSRSLGWLTNTRQIWLSCRPYADRNSRHGCIGAVSTCGVLSTSRLTCALSLFKLCRRLRFAATSCCCCVRWGQTASTRSTTCNNSRAENGQRAHAMHEQEKV